MTTLLEISKQALLKAQNENEFVIDDYKTFSNIAKELNKIDELVLKPYLIIWNMNVWAPYYDYICEALELLGYEYIGNMELSENKYNFDSKDYTYERLFKYKDKNCNYTAVLRK